MASPNITVQVKGGATRVLTGPTGGATKLVQLTDVSTATLANGYVLTYSSANNRFEFGPQTGTGGGGGGDATVIAAQLSSNVNQFPANTLASAITYDSQDLLVNIGHTVGDSKVYATSNGLYLIVTGIQVGRTLGGGEGVKFYDYWLRLNGVDVPNSTVRAALNDVLDTIVLVDNFALQLVVGDYVEVIQAVETAGLGIGAYRISALAGGPTVPSIIFTMLKVASGANAAPNTFSTINVAGQSNIVADSNNDTLTLVAGTGIVITTDAPNDTITFVSTGSLDQFARDQANSAFNQANTANVTGQAAFDRANSAYSNANTAIYTAAQIRANISNTAPVNYDPSTGIISHALSGVPATTYGNTTFVPTITVDNKGHITSVVNTAIALPPSTDEFARAQANAAFNQANTANVTGQAAFDRANGVVQTGFTTLNVAGQSDIVADSNNDVLIVAGNTVAGIIITTNATTDTVTISSNATRANTPNTIVMRDGGGEFEAGIIKLRSNTLQLGTQDIYGRNQIWNFSPGAVLRLGSWETDGDLTNVPATGIVTYGSSIMGAPLNNVNGAFSFIDSTSFNLYDIDSTLPYYSGGAYYFTLDPTQCFYKNNFGNTIFSVQRTSGNTIIAGSLNVYNLISGTLLYTPASAPNWPVVPTTANGAIDQLIGLTNSANASALAAFSKANGAVQTGFPTINVAGQSDIVADTNTDTLIVVAGSGIIITTDASTDTLTIAATGGASTDQYARDTANGAFAKANAAYSNANTAIYTAAQIRANISNTAPINYDPSTGIISHALSGATASGYGDAATVAKVVVDDKGHVTSVVNTAIAISAAAITSGTLTVARGGTGQTAITVNGSLLIGNTVSGGYDVNALTQGTGILITNDKGSITIAATGGSAVDQFARDTANGAFDKANTANTTADAAFNKANTANVTGQAAFDKANSAIYTAAQIRANISNAYPVYYNATTGIVSFVPATANGQTLIGNTVSGTFDVATLTQGTGVTVVNDKGTITLSAADAFASQQANAAFNKANGVVQNSFTTFVVASQADVVADSNTDILTLVAGAGIGITTVAGTDTITISAVGGGSLNLTPAFAQLSSNISQLPANTNAVAVFFDNNDALTGMSHAAGDTKVYVSSNGQYVIVFGGQVQRTSATGGQKNADYWIRKNGVDAPNSSVRISLTAVNETDVLIDNYALEMVANDYVEVIQAVEDSTIGMGLTRLTALAGGPSVPSIIFTMTKIIGSGNVSSVAGKTGAVILETSDVTENASGPYYFTAARVRANISNTAPINYDSTSGVISHALSGATASGYGDAATVPKVVVDDKGHVTSVVNTAITLAASAITSGILAVARGGTGKDATGLVNGSLLIGNTVNTGFDLTTIAQTVPVIVVNGKGTITLSHASSGVTATGYGTATQIPVFVVDTFGHITSVTNTAIAGLDAGVITTGTLVVARGGTGQSTYTNGQILIGNTGSTGLDKAVIAQSAPVIVTTLQGSITISHARSGVVALDSYGSPAIIPVLAIDANGHITAAVNTAVAISATAVTSGILSVARGGTGKDATGLTNGQILIANSVNTGFDLVGITQTAPVIVSTDKGSIRLSHARSGVTAATYGSASLIPVITVDDNGHITTVTTAAPSGLPPATANGQTLIGNTVSGSFDVALIAQTAPIIVTNGKGTITLSHASSGVVATGYGTAAQVPVFIVDAFGHVTGVTNTVIALAATQITSGVLIQAQGGTGFSGATANGQTLIGNTVSGGFDRATLTAGSGITINNLQGSIEIVATGGSSTDQFARDTANGAFTKANGAVQTGFVTIVVAGQSDVVADSNTDTLTLVAGTGMTITTNAGTDTVTLASAAGGGVSLGLVVATARGYAKP